MMEMAMTIIVRDIMIELVITKSKIDLHKVFYFLRSARGRCGGGE